MESSKGEQEWGCETRAEKTVKSEMIGFATPHRSEMPGDEQR